MNIRRDRSRLGVRVSTSVVVGLLAGALPPSAGATLPARNGKIAFKRYFDAAHSTSAIFVSDPDGRHERQITHPAHGVSDDGPDWSRDGRTITFSRCTGPVSCGVWVVGRTAPARGGSAPTAFVPFRERVRSAPARPSRRRGPSPSPAGSALSTATRCKTASWRS